MWLGALPGFGDPADLAERARSGAETTPVAAGSLDVDALVLEGMRLNLVGDRDGADAVWARLRQQAPTHPAGYGYQVSTLFWRFMYDDDDTRYDAAIESNGLETIRLSEAWLEREPDAAEAHYYLGQALMHLGRLDGTRGRYIEAGTRGERGRQHLERALELSPDYLDAKYPVGLYYYYADFISQWVRWLRFLWFFPKGDGVTGRRYMNEVADGRSIHRDNARFILSNINTYHDPENHERALELVEDLHARYPDNTLIHFELLEVLYESRDYRRLVEAAPALEAHPGSNHLDRGRRDMARIWRAYGELRLGRPQAALDILEVFGPGEPEHPYWGNSWTVLVRARSHDALGERERAKAGYKAVLAIDPGSSRARARAKAGLREPFRVRIQPTLRAAPGPGEESEDEREASP
jgi:tetratricopeptide (TPR) repeat protein